VDVVVVCKFSSQQELIPAILFVVCEDPDELFELLVDVLCLAVSLWVVSSGCCRLYTNEALQLPGKLSDELLSTIRDILSRGPVMPLDIPVVEPSGSDGSDDKPMNYPSAEARRIKGI
jgi:hypothetical protein